MAIPIQPCATPPEGRANAVCFALQDTIYIVSGRLDNGQYSSDMMIYDPKTDTWVSDISTPLTARVNAVACCNSTTAYIGLGYTGNTIYTDQNFLCDWWRYEAHKRKWTRLADFPSYKTVSAVAFADDNHIWVGFGFNGFDNELWCYSIEHDQWSQVQQNTPWPERLMSPVAAQVNGRCFQGTGFHGQGHDDWWEFFPDNQQWKRRASVPGKGRHNAACAATQEAIWIMGGWHYGDSLTCGFHFADILRYTPSNDQWIVCGNIPCGATENGVACAIGKTLFFGLGESDKSVLHQNWYRLEE